MTEQDCFFFGTIFKLHGYKGDVNIYNDNNISLNFTDIEFFYIKDNNELIPYFSENVRNKKKNILLVKFEDVDSEEDALKILKKEVFLPKSLKQDKEVLDQKKNILGFDVIDKRLGNIGQVKLVNESTAQSLIIVKNGEKEFFIPFHDQFVLKIFLDKKIIQVDIPKELININ
tara:strand:- start:7024 stop:7542 length:519 start_codon:yes stop_codon:yes gene_type:complete